MSDVSRSCFTEAHFCVMPTGTQSNVYGMSHYTTHASNSKSTCEKVLMACLNGDITLFEYALSDTNEPKPENNLFRAPYISENSEIVSLDSFTKLSAATGQSVIVLGITFINNIGQGASGFTAIYTAPLRLETPFYRSMEMVTDKGLPAAMEGIPCQITHAQIFKHGVSSTVFLVSTTCPKVHLFKEKLGKSSESTYKESSVGKYFSELQRETESRFVLDFTQTSEDHDGGLVVLIHTACIYFMDILYYEDNKYRLTCTGTEQGKITFFMVDVAENAILKVSESIGFGPVTSVVMFSDEPDVPIPEYLLPLYDGERREEPTIHVLICHALEVASIYRDIKKNGLEDQIVLKSSYNYDSVLCGCIADVDFDGLNEIILGTFGQKILAYKFDSSAPKEEATYLLWEHNLQYPIHSLIAVDLTGDGVKDLSVLSMRGLHILQKDINKAAGLVSERLTDLQNSFKKLELIEADHSNESLP